jgi:hypothetical protein
MVKSRRAIDLPGESEFTHAAVRLLPGKSGINATLLAHYLYRAMAHGIWLHTEWLVRAA